MVSVTRKAWPAVSRAADRVLLECRDRCGRRSRRAGGLPLAVPACTPMVPAASTAAVASPKVLRM